MYCMYVVSEVRHDNIKVCTAYRAGPYNRFDALLQDVRWHTQLHLRYPGNLSIVRHVILTQQERSIIT